MPIRGEGPGGLREGVSASATSPALQLEVGIVKKVELARAFLGLAQAAVRSSSDFNLYVAANHMQDAAEMFLFGVAEHLGVSLKEKGGFDGYFEQINLKTGKELPFRPRLNALNKTRVSSKHYGVQPERKEAVEFVAVVGLFFEEVSRTHLGVEFAGISLVHLIGNDKIREALSSAQEAFLEARHEDVLIESRKALYLEFESAYDVSEFIDKTKPGPLDGWWCSAPFYARTADYIKKNVNVPTDYIVLDHSKIDARLSKAGVSHTTFWNVWRLTPALFQPKDASDWIVKHEARVFDEDGIRERAEYVLHATVDLCLSAQRDREATRSGPYTYWAIRLRKGGVSLYQKADRKSVSQPMPDGVERLSALYWVKGFDGGIYWNVVLKDPWMEGFVSNEDVSNEEVNSSPQTERIRPIRKRR